MNRDELLKYKGVTGFSLGQVEKDYLQHIVLSALSRNSSGMIAFKGGTALQKTGIITRFSEDLDFTARGELSRERLKEITRGVFSAYNYPMEIDDEREDERSMGFRMKIQGPLYQGLRSLSTLRVEVSKREAILMPTDRKEITPLYSDIIPYVLEIMHRDEIAAEKVRAILTRDKARDVYDFYFLSARNIRIPTIILDKKLEYYGLKFDAETFIRKCEQYEKIWNPEMRYLIGTPPSIQQVMDKIRKRINKIVVE